MPDSRPSKQSKNGSSQARRSPDRSRSGDNDLSAPIGQPTSELMSMDFSDKNKPPVLASDQNIRCKKCGNICENGQCTSCKYIEPVFEKLYLPIDQIPIQIVGFQRWFCQTINEGIPIFLLKYISHLAVASLTVFLLVIAILGFLGRGWGPVGGMILLLLALVIPSVYAGLIYKGNQFLHKPNARLAWFQKPFWGLMLWMARKMKWQSYDNRCKGRKIFTIQDDMFGDFEFSQLDGLPNCQVLDLQGTRVSDNTINQLYQLKHLHCLVLKKTAVTSEAIFRLQQTFPRIWIWY